MGRGTIDDAFFEELEASLLEADTHVETVDKILTELRGAVRTERLTTPEEIRDRLRSAIAERFASASAARLVVGPTRPTVYLFVGVNGAGKTTTIGKLAARLVGSGSSVLLAAADTFRAAAIDQLAIWSERAGCGLVRSQPGADPAAVVFDAIQSAQARSIDFVLADTAGRQHTKSGLMDELTKVVRAVQKANGRPADEVLLVLDATVGQNALRQAEEFLKASGVTGLVLTKLDGSSRGGALIGVTERFSVPVKLVGVGERVEDLCDFVPVDFAQQLLEV